MAAESGTAPTTETQELMPVPEGWRRLEGVGGLADVFVLDTTRADYPEKWRSQADRHERTVLDRDPKTQEIVRDLSARWESIDFDRFFEAVVRASEIREHTGDPELSRQGGMFVDNFYQQIRQAAERVAPATGVTYPTALLYLAERTLPVDLVPYVVSELPEPVKMTVNADRRKKLLVSLMPGETMLRFRGIARRDLTRVGKFVTEALEITDPDQRRNRGGRPAITDEGGPATTPDLIARLFHWEGWSHRRIAAFLGWLGPDDDWTDPKVRARTEQRVRRYVRLGEGALRVGDQDDDGEGWKRRPRQLEQAVHTEERRERRR